MNSVFLSLLPVCSTLPVRIGFPKEFAHLGTTKHRLEDLDVLGVALLGSLQIADLLLKLGNLRTVRLDYLLLLRLDQQVRQFELFVPLCNLLFLLSLKLREFARKLLVSFHELAHSLGDVGRVLSPFKDIDVPVDDL